MRLRHKKPINSYAGQANHDSNVHVLGKQDALDEDFIRGSNLCKKGQVFNQRSSCDTLRKNAEFLCNFINSINQNYRTHLHGNQAVSKPDSIRIDASELSQPGPNLQQPRTPPVNEMEQVVSKEELNFQNRDNFIGRTNSATKKIKKNRPSQPPPSRPNDMKKSPELPVEPRKKITINTIQREEPPTPVQVTLKQPLPVSNPMEPQVDPPKQPNESTPAPLMPASALNQQLQNIINIQKQLLLNPMYAAMNPALYSLLPSFPMGPVGYGLYRDQIKNNSYFGMGNPMMNPLAMLQPNLLNNYIPFSRLPFNTNKQPEKKPEDKPDPRLQGSITKQQASNPIDKPIQLKSKSCYHIGIAYTIHYANLKEKGFTNFNSGVDIQKIDPTYLAKRARKKKNEESFVNMNDTTLIPH